MPDFTNGGRLDQEEVGVPRRRRSRRAAGQACHTLARLKLHGALGFGLGRKAQACLNDHFVVIIETA